MARCTGKTKAGTRCQRDAVKGTKRCAQHPPEPHREPDTPTPKRRARGSRRKPVDWRPAFLASLAAEHMVTAAAAAAGINRATAYERRDGDPDFAAEWAEIDERSIELLEREAYRRAAVGTQKPVFQGGKQVGTIREFSDNLLMFLLKAKRPNVYREHHLVEHAGDVEVNLNLVTDHELRQQASDLRRRLAAARSVKPGGPDARDRA